MKDTQSPPQTVEKEDIPNLKFPKDPVITDSEHKKSLQMELHKATSLGNLSKHKVVLIFEDSEGIKKVNTTIWAITETNLVLKRGVFLPIHRIHSVELIG